jgi:hypothetical protein
VSNKYLTNDRLWTIKAEIVEIIVAAGADGLYQHSDHLHVLKVM